MTVFMLIMAMIIIYNYIVLSMRLRLVLMVQSKNMTLAEGADPLVQMCLRQFSVFTFGFQFSIYILCFQPRE